MLTVRSFYIIFFKFFKQSLTVFYALSVHFWNKKGWIETNLNHILSETQKQFRAY